MKTGVIGLGAMGSGIALNLHKAGHRHRIWNRTASKVEPITELTGITNSNSIDALAAACELIIVCVSRDEDVTSVVHKISQAANSGAVVADTSTVSSDIAETAARIVREKRNSFLDCPVSGGMEGARKGVLSGHLCQDGEEQSFDPNSSCGTNSIGLRKTHGAGIG